MDTVKADAVVVVDVVADADKRVVAGMIPATDMKAGGLLVWRGSERFGVSGHNGEFPPSRELLSSPYQPVPPGLYNQVNFTDNYITLKRIPGFIKFPINRKILFQQLS